MMGKAQSIPLGLILNHFKDFCWLTKDSDLVVCPGKLMIFCRNKWLTYKVGWPEKETFHLHTIYRALPALLPL